MGALKSRGSSHTPGPVPGTVEIESQYEIATSAAVPGTAMRYPNARMTTFRLQRPVQGQQPVSGADGTWQEQTLSLIAVTDRGSLPLYLNAAAASRARPLLSVTATITGSGSGVRSPPSS